jgi:D-tyrosyl-tRNA(Tyr) deacylase
MICVIQRVKRAEVSVSKETVGKAGEGLLILLGVKSGDTPDSAFKMAEKILKMRVFPDSDGKMNLSVKDIQGEILVISNFTLCASCRHGNRPDFFGAEKPEKAQELYETFVKKLSESGLKTEKGEFGADMQISSELFGPVTIILDSEKDFAK